MPNPETNLVNRIRSAIRSSYPDAWVFKSAGGFYQTAGVPDLLVVINGHLFGMEVKCPRPGETAVHALSRATPRQLAQIEAIRRAGGTADVILDPRGALQLIESVLGPRFPTPKRGRPKKVPDPAC